nr:MAG TPA: hypothetical protein [Caudoviricetes sp.]
MKRTQEQKEVLASVLYDQGIRADDDGLLDDLMEDYGADLSDAEDIVRILALGEADGWFDEDEDEDFDEEM